MLSFLLWLLRFLLSDVSQLGTATLPEPIGILRSRLVLAPHWPADGHDGGAHLLPEVLERVLNRFLEPLLSLPGLVFVDQ